MQAAIGAVLFLAASLAPTRGWFAPSQPLNIEVKAESMRTRGLEKKVVRLVRERGIAGRVLFSSFNPITMRRLARLAPEIDRGILLTNGPHARLFERVSHATAVHPPAA